MNFLDNVTHAQRELIISLPYRVGHYISQSDTTGGDEATARELQALSNIIHGFADSMLGSEAIQYVMTETLAQKAKWQDWSKKMRAVPKDCKTAMDIMVAHLPEKDITAFQNHLMEIGEAVAMAFKEVQEQDHNPPALKKIEAKLQQILKSLSSKTQKPKRHHLEAYASISPNEREALHKVAVALGVNY
jgi:hypothetical protein